MSETKIEMRTKRRYAHELYPHPAEDEVRDLAVEVPYLYARAIGYDVEGTSWHDMWDTRASRHAASDRLALMIAARGKALIADALLQGLSGQEAWEWANVRNNPEGCEWVWERAVRYGVDPDAIKPYLCGPESTRHKHTGEPTDGGWRPVTFVAGRESECPECCEPHPSRLSPSSDLSGGV
jgi:hypothetical protein